MSYQLAVVTPTCARDAVHFGLLRRSLSRFAPGLPHIAIVQTEDLPAFATFRQERKLTLLPTAELLPAPIERERRKRAARPLRLNRLERSLRKRWGWFSRAAIDGWHVQQVSKFEAVRRLGHDGMLVLDSDAFLTRPLRTEDLWVDGRRPIYSSRRPGAEPHHWLRAACAIFGVPVPAGEEPWYVAQPYLFERKVTAALCQRLEALHGRPWMEVLLSMRPGDLSEFTLYGLFAEHIERPPGTVVVPGDPYTRWVFTAEDRAQLSALLDEAFDRDGTTRFVILQSDRHWPITPWRADIERRIDTA